MAHTTEMLRENKRMLDKAIRELDRERMALQNQEKKTIAEIKKMAREGQMVRVERACVCVSGARPRCSGGAAVPALVFGCRSLFGAHALSEQQGRLLGHTAHNTASAV